MRVQATHVAREHTWVSKTMTTIDFWFDYSCPYAYLGSTQVEALAARMGARLTWQPMLLGGVFRANETPQNLMNVLSPSKARHNAFDMHRWAEIFGVELRMPSAHPMRTVEALRATIVAGVDPKVIHGFYRAYWVEGRAPSDPATMRDVLASAGHDADSVLARIDDPKIKDDLRERTDRAIALGIFGAPSFVVDGERLYWGQDRMHFVEGRASTSTTQPTTQPTTRSTTRSTTKNGTEPSMKHTLEIYWDFSSPFSYLGATQAEALAARTGATLTWRPMLLGGVFKAIGQVEAPILGWSDAKRRYYFQDLQRWAEHWGVPLRWPSRFPIFSLKAMRTYLALPEDRRDDFRAKTFRAYWADDRDISDDATLRELVGPGADEILARTQLPEIKQALVSATQRAVDAGVFGAPTWVVDGDQLFWGQDRIELVERALRDERIS